MIYKEANRVEYKHCTYGSAAQTGRASDHYALDVDTLPGMDDTIHNVALAPGAVEFAGSIPKGNDRTWEWGEHIRIFEGQTDTAVREGTIRLTYAHNKAGSLRAKRGDIVQPGQALATMGMTGNASLDRQKEHCHFQVDKRINGKWVPQNPMSRAGIPNAVGVYYNESKGGDATMSVKGGKGIDVSKYQGVIDWPKVKAAGIQFAILRAVSSNKSGLYIDPYLEANYKGAKAVGIPVGAYLYSYATTTARAQEEAQFLLKAIKGMQFELPVWFDQEYEPSILALSKAQRTAIVTAFCRTMEAAGYYSGLYASTDFINNRLDYDSLRSFDIWAAQYANACTVKLPYGVWQHTSKGSVPGISGNVDMNIAYKDYPTIIKGAGLNGFTKGETGQPAGDGDGAQQDKDPEVEAPGQAQPAAKLYMLEIGPASTGDKIELETRAKALGLPVTIKHSCN